MLLTAKIENSKNHNNNDIQVMDVTVVNMYDFCCFWSVAVNSVYKLQFFNIYLE